MQQVLLPEPMEAIHVSIRATRIGGLIGQIAPTSGPVSITFSYAIGAVSRVHTSATVPYLIGGLVGTTTQ